MSTHQLERRVPAEQGFDLLVAGGGPAGTAAAVCAARLGARVLLAESTGCLGGMATSGLVTAFNPMADGEKLLVRGLMEEIVETLYLRQQIPTSIRPDQWRRNYCHWTPFNPEGLKLLLDELAEQAGVEVRFFTQVVDVEVDQTERRIGGVVLHNVEGYRYVEAKAYIDATGDAVLTALCGASCREPGRDTTHPMPATLCSVFAGIDWKNIRMGGMNGMINPDVEQEALGRAIADGMFTQPDKHLPGMMRIGDTIAFLNAGHLFHLNSLRWKDVTDGMKLGRKLAVEYMEFYRKYVPGFENIEHVTTAPLMGVRESRRIVGEYELTYADYQARRMFPDQIGVFSNFVDIHPYDLSAKEMKRLETEVLNKKNWLGVGECFGLPYGILVPRGWKNLWVAGRCNSSDVRVHGAIRVQPAAVMMGQAAGTAAVQAINTRHAADDLDMIVLVKSLREQGAYLPQGSLRNEMTRQGGGV